MVHECLRILGTESVLLFTNRLQRRIGYETQEGTRVGVADNPMDGVERGMVSSF